MIQAKDLVIVEATNQDADFGAWLMYLAFDDLSQYLFGSTELKDIQHYFKSLWVNHNNRMSSRLSYVIRDQDKPIALLSCYEGDLTRKLLIPSIILFLKINPGFLIYLFKHLNYLYSLIVTPEANKDEFYIFMLAVLSEYQDKGLGTKLLGFATQKAIERNFKKVSLLVSAKNIDAIRFYERNGFKKAAQFTRKPYNHYKMIKEIN